MVSKQGCPDCGKAEAEPCIRCLDCMPMDVVCGDCVVRRHRRTPLHRVQRWNGEFYERETLRGLGLAVQLGHGPGGKCGLPQASHKDFVVIHVNGIHLVNVNFCGCKRLDRHIQLLRFSWWPATPLQPQSAATFDVLKHFHLVTLQGKLNATDFYRALELHTDNTGLESVPDRLPNFMLMVREWRHIKAMKRAGRGHEEGGVDATEPGELAIKCPACPRPGVNIPVGGLPDDDPDQ
ncbi:hypothetical protein DENSPDRAFT_789726 [Dentipellis sp. KUC8613]|nr:hypothetical protein DENSPDRAFT_789726 [Dentipellis sp. KUC8613]